MKNISYALLMLLTAAPLLAANEEVPMPPDQGLWQTLVMITIALAFFYMILWRPEQKRRKAMEQQRNALKKGDRVTAMGIIGTVSSISENTIVLKMIDGAKIEFLKAAITDVIPDDKEEPKKEEK